MSVGGENNVQEEAESAKSADVREGAAFASAVAKLRSPNRIVDWHSVTARFQEQHILEASEARALLDALTGPPSARIAEIRARAERVLSQVARVESDARHAQSEWQHQMTLGNAIRLDGARKRLEGLGDIAQLARDVVALTDPLLVWLDENGEVA